MSKSHFNRVRMGTGILALALISASLGACSPGPLTETDLALANLEGRWMCDVQRFTFDDIADIDIALDERLDGNGFTRSEYRKFKDRLIGDERIRSKIQVSYDEYCS